MQHISPRRSQHQQQRAAPIAANVEYEPKRNSRKPRSGFGTRELTLQEVDRPRYPSKSDCIKQTEHARNESHGAICNR